MVDGYFKLMIKFNIQNIYRIIKNYDFRKIK